MKPSSFGKILRKLRIDHNEILLDMAKKLEVTASYLSAVENGKRVVPEDWPEKIVQLYSLDESAKEQLLQAAVEQLKSIKLDIEEYTPERKKALWAFARRIQEMDETELNSIWEIFKKKDKR